MRFTSFLDGGRLTVALTGEIDHHCAKSYIQTIIAKIEAYTPKVCVLDFSEVSFMDSSGIGVLLGRLRILEQRGGSLAVKNMSQPIAKLFHLTGLQRVIQVQNDKTGGRL